SSNLSASTWMNSASACRRNYGRSCGTFRRDWAESLLFADVLHGQRRAGLRHPAKADQALAFRLHAVAADERFLTFFRGDERAVGALVDQQELVPVELDAGVQPGNQIPFDDDSVLLGAADRDVRAPVVDDDLLALKAHAQAAHALLLAGRGIAESERRQHAGGVFLLPQHLEQLVLAGLALERGDVDLAARRLPFGRK